MNNMSNTSNEKVYVGIDPSTKTGLVVIDKEGNVLQAGELRSEYKDDPRRMLDLAKKLRKHLTKYSVVCIENWSYNSSGRGVSVQYGIGWAFRFVLFEQSIPYAEIAPTSAKKFATGSGRANKQDIINAAEDKFGFATKSDNVADAFFMAHIARAMDNKEVFDSLTNYQKEVVLTLLKKEKK